MKELQQIVNEQINTMITNGAIEQMIADKLNVTVKECINEAMRSYGDFGKSIKGKIEESINASLNHVSIPEYNKFISDLVLESYTEAMNSCAKEQMKKLLDEHLAPAPKQMTAAEVLSEIRRYWEDEAREYGHYQIEIDWEKRDTAIYMNVKNPQYDWNFINITFYNHAENDPNTYHIGYISEDERTISRSITGATHALGLAGFFYKLYCASTKFTGFDEALYENIYLGDD
ncbi:TPA: hypothetical protein ACGG8H_003386 [Vibrio cholerae]